MGNLNLRKFTNRFLDVRLVSLASWRQANDIIPRDHGRPSIPTQEGCVLDDLKPIADGFVLGRSGKSLSLGLSVRLPVADRRAEFVFGPEIDETAAAYRTERGNSGGAKT